MKTYVQVAAGPFELLVDAAMVHEVAGRTAGADAGVAGVWWEWRGQTLPVVGGRRLLGLADATGGGPAAGLVLESGGVGTDGGDALLAVLEVDAVRRLLRLDEARFAALPPLPAPVRRLFDGLYLDPDTRTVAYRLRPDLDLSARDP